MFENIFVENCVEHHPKTIDILSRLNRSDYHVIDRVENIFGRAKKPYLHKRDSLNLFLGAKRGQIVKKAPPAYGNLTGEHYFFYHQYNCIYECEYCYLQGYFNSPDIVFFVNHEDILNEIKRYAFEIHSPNQEIWFHAGEFSDSLALNGITREWGEYWDLFKNMPHTKLELRTKSSNIRLIQELGPVDNIIVSFSISTPYQAQKLDRKASPIEARLKSAIKLAENGFKIGFHFDPIIYYEGWYRDVKEMIETYFSSSWIQQIEYISMGTVRFTKEVKREVELNYPDSLLLQSLFLNGFDQKYRYPENANQRILGALRQLLLNQGLSSDKLYECMAEISCETNI